MKRGGKGKRPKPLAPNTTVDVSLWMSALGWQKDGDTYIKLARQGALFVVVGRAPDDVFNADMLRCLAFENQMHRQQRYH